MASYKITNNTTAPQGFHGNSAAGDFTNIVYVQPGKSDVIDMTDAELAAARGVEHALGGVKISEPNRAEAAKPIRKGVGPDASLIGGGGQEDPRSDDDLRSAIEGLNGEAPKKSAKRPALLKALAEAEAAEAERKRIEAEADAEEHGDDESVAGGEGADSLAGGDGV